MLKLNFHPTGRHFLQIPGPSPVPDRILRAMAQPTIDHRGPEFAGLGLKVLADARKIFQTQHPVVIYPGSGTGAWEAALVNLCSPGDTVVMYETGHFAALWNKLALKLGLKTEVLGLPQGQNWRRGVQADLIEQRLSADTQHQIRAVCVVHNETSTGVTSDILAVRQAIDRAKHPALLLVDTISGVGAADYRHDEWGVDVSMGGSQKGLMMPRTASASTPSGMTTPVRMGEYTLGSSHWMAKPQACTACRTPCAQRWWRANTWGKPSSNNMSQASLNA